MKSILMKHYILFSGEIKTYQCIYTGLRCFFTIEKINSLANWRIVFFIFPNNGWTMQRNKIWEFGTKLQQFDKYVCFSESRFWSRVIGYFHSQLRQSCELCVLAYTVWFWARKCIFGKCNCYHYNYQSLLLFLHFMPDVLQQTNWRITSFKVTYFLLNSMYIINKFIYNLT